MKEARQAPKALSLSTPDPLGLANPSTNTPTNFLEEPMFNVFSPLNTPPILQTPPIGSTPPLGSDFPFPRTFPPVAARLFGAEKEKTKSSLSSLVKVEDEEESEREDTAGPHHGLHLLASVKEGGPPAIMKLNSMPGLPQPQISSGVPGSFSGSQSDLQGFFASPEVPPEAFKRKRRVTKDMSPDQKRNVYLDRNKQAASKCRQKKKQWLNETQTKMETLQRFIKDLQDQVMMLKVEQQKLLEYLTMHQNCGSDRIAQFLKNREEWEREIMMIQAPPPPLFPSVNPGDDNEGESGSEESEGEE